MSGRQDILHPGEWGWLRFRLVAQWCCSGPNGQPCPALAAKFLECVGVLLGYTVLLFVVGDYSECLGGGQHWLLPSWAGQRRLSTAAVMTQFTG
jgi:hypothetical protein